MAGSGTAHLRSDSDTEVVLRATGLTVEFPVGRHEVVHAVSDVSFDVVDAETLGIVGESGCGKTTTGRAVMQLEPVTSGSVELFGEDLTGLSGEDLRHQRRAMQMIFQDPVSSLNPRRTVWDLVNEGPSIWHPDEDESETTRRTQNLLAQVGLDADRVSDRRAHEFSGGQCQRISIARALALDPRVLICDEPVSALDVSVQAQILNLLEDLRDRYGLAMVFISHDLAVVSTVCDRVMVMYLGKVCETAPTEDLFDHPAHPYTRALLASIPGSGTERSADGALAGELPSPIDPPSGCRFRTRCPRATELCATDEPEIRAIGEGHFVACHHPHDDDS
jgi:peptide/nickel transport system ATP-binding protein